VPIYYDPILAKLIVWAEDRKLACRRMVNALDDYVILGIKTTIDFLKDVINHPQFRAGKTTTSFIQKHFDQWKGKKKTEENLKVVLIASAFDSLSSPQTQKGEKIIKKEIYSPWQSLGKWRIGGK